jgi:hypothetical protein
MVDGANNGNGPAAAEPIEVSGNLGAIDALQATGRYLVVIVAAVTALATFVKARDAAGAVSYLQANGGVIVGAVSGLVAIGTAAYGVFKTHKRGAQVATVAADPRVPEQVATIKE